MYNKIIKTVVGVSVGIVSWLTLSYFFFPIKLEAPSNVYFEATMTHMLPLKSFITIVFVLLSLFICEQKLKKNNRNK